MTAADMWIAFSEMKRVRPSEPQAVLLREYARRRREFLPAPTIRELMEVAGVKSTNDIAGKLARLAREGYLTLARRRARSMMITEKGLRAVEEA